MNWNQALFPSLQRRGRCGINKTVRSLRSAADGVVSSAKLFRPKDFADLTTPSARTKVASRHFLDRAATPPFQGGECVRTETVCQLIHFLCKAPHSARIAFDESHQMVRACCNRLAARCQCIRTDRTRSASASTELLPDCGRGRKHWCSGGRRWCRRCRFGFGSKRWGRSGRDQKNHNAA